MTCEEFRRSWLDAGEWSEGRKIGRSENSPTIASAHESAWESHPVGCAACRIWLEAERSLDELFGAALVTSPPPELSARLAKLPSLAVLPPAAPTVAPAWDLLVEMLLLVAIGLSAIAFGVAVDVPAATPVLDRVTAILQAIPLVLSAPLLGYLQGLAVTVTEAMATLLLLALGLYRLYPSAGGWAQTE
jgi:hypothetical protein